MHFQTAVRTTHVIVNAEIEGCHCEPVPQHWCGNPFLKAFPHGEGGSRVSRKRETDEGLCFFYFPHPPSFLGHLYIMVQLPLAIVRF